MLGLTLQFFTLNPLIPNLIHKHFLTRHVKQLEVFRRKCIMQNIIEYIIVNVGVA